MVDAVSPALTASRFVVGYAAGEEGLLYSLTPTPSPSKHWGNCQTLPLLSTLMMLGEVVAPYSYRGTLSTCVLRRYTTSGRVNGLPPPPFFFQADQTVGYFCEYFAGHCYLVNKVLGSNDRLIYN